MKQRTMDALFGVGDKGAVTALRNPVPTEQVVPTAEALEYLNTALVPVLERVADTRTLQSKANPQGTQDGVFVIQGLRLLVIERLLKHRGLQLPLPAAKWLTRLQIHPGIQAVLRR